MKVLIWFLPPASFAFAQPQPGIEVIHVRGNVYMFASDEGNITVQVGEHRDNDGALMVDTGPTSMTERVQTELHKLTNKPLLYIVNTSADSDRVGGNAVLKGNVSRGGANNGPRGPTSISMLRQRLTRLSAPGAHMPYWLFLR